MKHLFKILVLIFSFHFSSLSQVCDGNLGENIFAIGDFGFGEDNNILLDPGIAPGYIYTTSGPPSDGYYTISNNMGMWPNLYGTWLPIGDMSDNPLGYMMVVNASFEPGIFYEEEIDGLCENTTYEFSADVINLIRTGVTGHIAPNVSFLLNGQVMYTSGQIPQDETWHKFGFTFITEPGQETVILTLRNNAPGGIGNDLALDNISFRPCGPNAFANAEEEFLLCSNDLEPTPVTAETSTGSSIQWQTYNASTETWEFIDGATETTVFHDIFEPGEYLYRYLSAGSVENLENEKCRVISDVATVTVLPVEFTLYDTICENVIYNFGNQELSEEGFYEETFLASTGCDSFVDLFLTVVPEVDITFDIIVNDPSCFDYSDGSIEILNVTGGVEPYQYLLDDGNTGSNSFNDLNSGTFNIKVQDKYSCMSDLSVQLINPELFVVDIGNDTQIDLGSTLIFPLSFNYQIESSTWTGSELSCIQCAENSARPLNQGRYSITAINEQGCVASDSILVGLKEIGEQFYKPNIFSPNDDGINDFFELYSNSLAINFVNLFSIVDRWGNIVYTVENVAFDSDQMKWNGKLNGSPLKEGVYSYFLSLKLINGNSIKIRGDFTLIR